MKYAFVGILGFVAGCKGGQVAHCELNINDVTVCIEDAGTYNFCSKEVGGEATVANKSSDPKCADLGYQEECEGIVRQEGESISAEYPYYAKSAEDCAAAEGGQFTTN